MRLDLTGFAGNVWRSVHRAVQENPDIVRTFFTVLGPDLHSITLKRYEPIGLSQQAFIRGQSLYAGVSQASIRELINQARGSSFLASSFATLGTPRDDNRGQRIFDLVIAVERGGDTIFGAVYRQSTYYSGYLELSDVPGFAIAEARLLRRYLQGVQPEVVAAEWAGVGIVPVDRF